tara:strand:+ start:702 stop:920 length:219 start_codon:yes stop_codon:yes gene_type:complete
MSKNDHAQAACSRMMKLKRQGRGDASNTDARRTDGEHNEIEQRRRAKSAAVDDGQSGVTVMSKNDQAQAAAD